MSKRIRKVKYDGENVTIHYEEERTNGGTDEYTLRCADKPTQEFIHALNDLGDLIPLWIDVPESWAQHCEIRGAFFSYKNDIFGGGFTFLKPLKNCASPFVGNCPHKPSEPYSQGGDDNGCLTTKENELLLAVCKQAELYLDGERAQMELPIE